ncbi:MAG: site-specific integrase [Thaumarchaeota archaeon]|nr:site-specific integrase [Nitrososphaerota archaeon]MBI3641067.1 site-specific integrase [Nitrososphaerota archaeon]
MGRSLVMFESAIKSEVTKKSYLWNLNKFLEWAKLPDPDGLLQLKESYLQTMLEDYILYLRKKVSPNSINAMHAPLQLFFEMNEKKLDFKKIRRLFPAKNKKSGYNAWQTEDIKLMLQQTTSKRNRALIHFLASTGCRIGALLDLKSKHVSQIENCKSVSFYPDTNDEYWGFLTPEASKTLDEYQEERIRDGESLNQESPIFRTSYQIGIQKPLPLSHSSIKNVISRVTKNVSKIRHKTSKTRYNIQMDHGFRKRFATIIKLDNRIVFQSRKDYLDTRHTLIQNILEAQERIYSKNLKKWLPI